jgi:dolichol kinase
MAAEDILELTSGLYQFLVVTEETYLAGRKAAEEARFRVLERARLLSQRFHEARQSAGVRFGEMYDEIAAGLREFASEVEVRRPTTAGVRAAWQRLGRQYEALLASVRTAPRTVDAEVHLAHLKPRNYHRNLFHVSVGLTATLAYEFLLDRTAMLTIGLSILLAFVVMDVLRRLSPAINESFVNRAFGKISRPSEAHRVPSATWYLTALLLGAFCYPKLAIQLGALALAFGDPAASLVGKRWGRWKLLGEKSLMGTLGFFGATLAATATFLALVAPGLGVPAILGICAAVALVGAVTELLSSRLDDNLTIPLVAGGIAYLLLILL